MTINFVTNFLGSQNLLKFCKPLANFENVANFSTRFFSLEPFLAIAGQMDGFYDISKMIKKGAPVIRDLGLRCWTVPQDIVKEGIVVKEEQMNGSKFGWAILSVLPYVFGSIKWFGCTAGVIPALKPYRNTFSAGKSFFYLFVGTEALNKEWIKEPTDTKEVYRQWSVICMRISSLILSGLFLIGWALQRRVPAHFFTVLSLSTALSSLAADILKTKTKTESVADYTIMQSPSK